MINRKHFHRGSGVFTCTSCGRRTRNSAAAMCGALGFEKMCEECYELAGIYNTFQNEGAEGIQRYADEIHQYCEKITASGGKLDSDAEELLEAIEEAQS